MAEDNAGAGALTTASAPALAGAPATNANTALLTPDKLTPATEMAASGAFIEPTIVERIPVDHPAIDNSPRAGQCVGANRIDMNDPSVPGHVQVARNLGMAETAEPAPAKTKG